MEALHFSSVLISAIKNIIKKALQIASDLDIKSPFYRTTKGLEQGYCISPTPYKTSMRFQDVALFTLYFSNF